MSEVFLGTYSPLSISGCILWMDAQDPSATGVQPSNGTSLTSWKDKSTSGFTLTSSGSAYNTTALNGFPGINIGTNFIGYDPGSGQNNWQEVFAVGIWTGGSTFTNFNGFITTSVDGDGGVSGGGIILVASGSGQTTFGGGPGQYTTTPWINGVQTWTALPAAQSTFVVRTAVASSVNLRGIRFGVDRSNGRPWVGFIGECICYNTALTLTQRQQIEGYLAWKWGINTSLPSSHPYYSTNPLKVTGFPPAIQSIISPPVTPLKLVSSGCALWLDGADPTTVVFSSGSNISQWNDKSGNGINITQSTSSNQPSYTASSNSVLFSDTTYLTMGNISYFNTLFASPFTMFFVHKKLQSYAWLVSPGNYVVTFPGTLRVTTAGITDLDFTTPTFTTAAAEPLRMFTIQLTGTERNVRMNGQLTAYNMNNNGSTSWTTAPVVDSNWRMGGNVNAASSAGQTQNMYEVIFYNTALGTTQRQQIEGYLAWKWGINTSLPSGHPYYAAAPSLSVPFTIKQTFSSSSAVTFSYTGADQTYVVPAGTFSLTVYLWGAGGGSTINGSGNYGGAGACLTGTLLVTAGETLTIVVGGAGANSSSKPYGGGGNAGGYTNLGYSCSGGGRSAIRRSTTDVVTAGAGGGGRSGIAGAGGITTGGTGQNSSATGGTQTGGGIHTGGGIDGSLYAGGNAGQDNSAGGGSGYYGGGGGGQDNNGGGGSSLYSNLVNYTGYTSSNGYTAPNNTSPYYVSGVGNGGSVTSAVPGTGGPGLVVLIPYTQASPPAAVLPVITVPNTASITTVTTTGSNYYTVPAGSIGVYVYLWGAGGQVSSRISGYNGGGGAFVSGFYSCSPGTNLIYVVGSVGGATLATGNGAIGNGHESDGGGFSGLFLSNAGGIAQSNAIAIAGGGGGSGWMYGGGGGYPAGGNGSQNGSIALGYGGTQTAGGAPGGRHDANGVNSTAGSALTGGTGGYEGGGAPEGGGGGGWYGGGGGGGANGGGGGSSYIGNVNGATGGIGLTSGAYYENGGDWSSGVLARPGGTTNKYYVAGVGSGSNTGTTGTGLVVIIPAITALSNTFQITTPPNYQVSTILSYTGAYQYYTVPQNIISLSAYMWGAGGGGGAANGFATTYSGGGAFLQGTIAVIPGEQLRLIVGQGGQTNTTVYYSTMTDAQGGGGGGIQQGGGRTAIQKYIGSTWTEVFTAGGGGASPRTNYGGSGGNAYYTGTSQAGSGSGGASGGGQGGSSTAGGAATTLWQTNPSGVVATAGTQGFGGLAGGHTGYTLGTASQLPGGGGGYYGGGGGWINDGGGGGGSYANSTYVSNVTGANGNYATPVGTTAPGYVTGAGVGVTAVAAGSNGLISLVATLGLRNPFPTVTTGGTITTSGSYRIHTFTTVGTTTFTTNLPITAQVLIVGGGGSGGVGWGASGGGGGGAGGALFNTISLAPGIYSVVVGAGGTGSTSSGSNGGNSVAFGYTATGGGGGGTGTYSAGSNGGCGGGCGSGNTPGTGSIGFSGGTIASSWVIASGGGGMGSAGSTGTYNANGGNGGNGATYTIGGSSYTLAGGGGGCGVNGNPGYGQAGGGNGGTNYNAISPTSATANTGSGGGGLSVNAGGYLSGSGGSGIVIIAFTP